MSRSPTVLILIPARGGSKRIPKKNIRPLKGKPLIAYSIKAARASRADRVLVSTDDPSIAKIAQRYRAEVPFLRPAALATDKASTVEAVLHALSKLKKKEGWQPDIVVVVQPTSPFVQAKDIDAAVRILLRSKATSCVSVCAVSKRPEWMFFLKRGKLFQRYPADLSKRSQELPALYTLNGAVYATRTAFILKAKKLVDTKRLAAHVMPRERSIDIDDFADWKEAERSL